MEWRDQGEAISRQKVGGPTRRERSRRNHRYRSASVRGGDRCAFGVAVMRLSPCASAIDLFTHYKGFGVHL